MTIGGYIGELVGAQRTHAEWSYIGEQSRRYLRDHFGFDPTPQERAELEVGHAAIMAGLAPSSPAAAPGETQRDRGGGAAIFWIPRR